VSKRKLLNFKPIGGALPRQKGSKMKSFWTALKFVGAITTFYAAFIVLTAYFINGYWHHVEHGYLLFVGAGAVIVLATLWLNEIMRG
tara:strand:- start:163 stop:423 length:261 start_codon:yes stop_codon:yes gene_type:complete